MIPLFGVVIGIIMVMVANSIESNMLFNISCVWLLIFGFFYFKKR